MPPAPLPHSHARRGDRPPPAMLPAPLHDEPGTFPTSVAGVAAAPLRRSLREIFSPAAPRTHRAAGAAGHSPGRAPLAALGAKERSKAKPGSAEHRRAPPHAATASLSPAPAPRSPAHMRGEDPSAHGHPLPSHCSRPPLARTESPLPFAAHTHTHKHSRTHQAFGRCFGGEGDAAPAEQSQRIAAAEASSAPHAWRRAAPPLPFPGRCRVGSLRSLSGCSGARDAPRGGENGGAPVPRQAPRGCHGRRAAATSAAGGAAGTEPSRPRSAPGARWSAPRSGKRQQGKGRKKNQGLSFPYFLTIFPPPHLETKVEVETEWAGW